MTDPVVYTVTIEHWADGEVDVRVQDVDSTPRDRASIAWALRRAADLIEQGEPKRKGELS